MIAYRAHARPHRCVQAGTDEEAGSIPAEVSGTPRGRQGSAGEGMAAGSTARSGDPPETSAASLTPVPSTRSDAPLSGEPATLSNGAALYRGYAIPWKIEAAAMEAVEDSLQH